MIEINYYGSFSVVLFWCELYQNEVDEYRLTGVYFNKLCIKDDPSVLASQIYKVFYVADRIKKYVYYAMNKVPVYLYDLDLEYYPCVGDSFLGEPIDDIGSLDGLDEVTFYGQQRMWSHILLILHISTTFRTYSCRNVRREQWCWWKRLGLDGGRWLND